MNSKLIRFNSGLVAENKPFADSQRRHGTRLINKADIRLK